MLASILLRLHSDDFMCFSFSLLTLSLYPSYLFLCIAAQYVIGGRVFETSDVKAFVLPEN